MALPSSGVISLSAIQTEFGGSSPYAITNYYRGAGLVPNTPANIGIPTSGQIQLDDFYSASKGTVTWTARSLPTASQWILRGTYTGTTYVIVGWSGKVYRSTDGITWTASLASATHNMYAVATNGSQVVVMSRRTSDSQLVPFTAPSPAGPYTSTASIGSTAVPRDLTYSPSLGMYVLVCDGGVMYTSTNGTTWTSRTSSFGATNINKVKWGGSTFVAVGSSAKIATSPDGINWTQRTSTFGGSGTIQSVTYTNGLFIAVGGASGFPPYTSTSPTGVTWTGRTGVPLGTAIGTGTFSGNPVSLAVNGTGGSPTGAISYNGSVWLSAPKPVASDVINDVIGGGSGRFVVVGADSGISTGKVYTVDIS